MSTLRKYKRMENALYARGFARIAAASSSIKAFIIRTRAIGRQKLTIMLIPHTEKRILNIQLSFFALGGILLAACLVILAFIFSAARFSDTANKLQNRSSDLADTQSSLTAIRSQARQLVTAAKRFESALSGTLDRIGPKAAGASSQAKAADPASAMEASAVNSPVHEINELQWITNYLERSVDPLKELGSLLSNQSAILTEVPNIWPVRGVSHVSMYYGPNENPFSGQLYIHKGIDISTFRSGDPVLATADGSIAAIGYDASLGNYIIVKHNHGFITRYAHLMAFRVSKGQKVQQGQIIGLLGNTGLTTGPHLHYEVHLGTGVIDPTKFLSIRSAQAAVD